MGKTAKDRRINSVLSVVLTIVCILWMYPVFMILMNSLKTERAITTTHAFELPTAETFVGLKNYIYGIAEMDFLSSLWYSFIITISSVALILLCCSMCAWYITRVQGVLSKGMYYLCVFSMIVPFQMVMFTLAKTADTLKLNNPYNICIIYLGFGAGLAVFMFTGFVKSMPIAIEEAAMIDGCNPHGTDAAGGRQAGNRQQNTAGSHKNTDLFLVEYTFGLRAPYQPLTAPATTPSIMYFWQARYSTMTGMTVIIMQAIMGAISTLP